MRRVSCFVSTFLFACATLSAASYSPARHAGDFLYVSGQLPIDPTTGLLISGNIQDLTNQIIDNITSILHIKGFNLSDVVKTEVSLLDIRDYAAMDAAYALRFPSGAPPARDVVQVVNLPFNDLNNDARIQISCIAYKVGGGG